MLGNSLIPGHFFGEFSKIPSQIPVFIVSMRLSVADQFVEKPAPQGRFGGSVGDHQNT